MRGTFLKRYASSIVGLLVFFADFLTKRAALYSCFSQRCIINQFLSFNVVFNRGVTWSLFHTTKTIGFVLVTGMVILITLGLIYYAYKNCMAGKSIYGEAMIIGGSCSNILDRFMYGGVVDFIEVSYDGWIWPAFNLADASIVIGVGLMMMKQYKEGK